jgi:CheY-like chemotaxis protein
MSISILVVDDEPGVADLFRQCFRREARKGTYVLHFAYSGEEDSTSSPRVSSRS